MSIDHGEIVLQKPISEYAIYIKNLIPANIPEFYAIKPMFENIASKENIQKGIVAFRDFIHLFCDRLISDGDLYVKPKKTKNPTDYEFLHNINHLLIDIGNHSQLSASGDSLLITDIPSFTSPKSKISSSKQMECFRFLAICGFVFNETKLEEKKINTSDIQLLEVFYPNNPILLTGLKVLSIADIELRMRRYSNDDNIFRCDYRLIKAEDTDMLDILKDFVHPLPENLQKLAIELHQRYIDMGMTCVTLNDNAIHFAYAYTKNSKRVLSTRDIYQMRVWEFYLSMKYGYCIFVRSKQTDKYQNVINKFHISLQEKIAQGYGCDRKLRNEPCQSGCQGIRIPLDETIFEIKQDIEIWIDNELPSSVRY